MNDLPWMSLIGVFWVGFSLGFYSSFFVLVVLHTGRMKDIDPSMRMSLYRRLAITIPGFIGVAGTCSLLGAMRQTSHWDMTFVLGVPAGVLVALFMKKRM